MCLLFDRTFILLCMYSKTKSDLRTMKINFICL